MAVKELRKLGGDTLRIALLASGLAATGADQLGKQLSE